MVSPSVSVALVSASLTFFAAGVASAQTASTSAGPAYPSKPVRIVTSAPGGAADLIARLVAQGISAPLGQPVIVDNRAGSVIIPAEVVSKAAPDGYTLLLHGNSFWLGTLLAKTSYDALKDFLPISMLASSPQILVVHPSLPAKSVKELVTLAKATPGALNYASTNSGSSNHLAAELFKSMARVDIVRIGYKSTATAITGGVVGETQLQFASSSSITPHVKSGRLRPVAVSSVAPSALYPGLPTVAATLPGFDAATSQGIFAPAQSPLTIVNRLNHEIVRVLNLAEVKERMLSIGVETVGSSPGDLGAAIKSEMTRFGKVIRDVGITAD